LLVRLLAHCAAAWSLQVGAGVRGDVSKLCMDWGVAMQGVCDLAVMADTRVLHHHHYVTTDLTVGGWGLAGVFKSRWHFEV
jgi:hypothetical protein